jgi:flagellar hook-associated protein 3 FlgL
MSRVSENSTRFAVNNSIGKNKSRLENLQIQSSNLKRIQRPSDDPIANVELLSIRTENSNIDQFSRNANFAKTQLEFTEAALGDFSDVVQKAKEIALGQASNIYNPDIRQSVAKEVRQLRMQAIGISNRRLGNRFIFSGFKTLTRPFSPEGRYKGDGGKVTLEVDKDFFVKTNIPGSQIFYHNSEDDLSQESKLQAMNSPDQKNIEQKVNKDIDKNVNKDIDKDYGEKSENQAEYESGDRNLASQQQVSPKDTDRSIFDDLKSLENALLTNNSGVIQNLLESFDDVFNNTVKLRTQTGALINSIDTSLGSAENTKILNQTYKSRLEDADVAELFSDLQRQQAVMQATYESSSRLMNRNLMDFLR